MVGRNKEHCCSQGCVGDCILDCRISRDFAASGRIEVGLVSGVVGGQLEGQGYDTSCTIRRAEMMKWVLHFSVVWALLLVHVALMVDRAAADNNHVYQPCKDTTVARKDGFSFGFITTTNASLYYKNMQLSPCDKRLTSLGGGQVAVFRPQVDQISLLVINVSLTHFSPQDYGGYAVAYAGSKYAAVSKPVFLANGSYHVTSLSLVMNFNKGRLVSLLWKTDKCASCTGKNSTFVCLHGEQCAIKTSLCNSGNPKTKVDCSLSIQTTFSGTDVDDEPLNSWYQFSKIQQYSLYAVFNNLKQIFKNQFHL